jgi:hypothetical protein
VLGGGLNAVVVALHVHVALYVVLHGLLQLLFEFGLMLFDL